MLQFLLPLLAAGVSYAGQNQAANRQLAEMAAANQRQLQARNQATDAVMKRVQEFDPTERGNEQAQIEEVLAGQYREVAQAPIPGAQGIQAPSADYQVADAKEKSRVAESLRQLASLMGRTQSAGQLRLNEGLRIGDTAGDVGRIQSGASAMSDIDKMAIQAAGQPSAGYAIASGLLNGAGAMYGAGGGAKITSPNGSYTNPNFWSMVNIPRGAPR
jgi:hypothetical protein